MKTKRFEIFAHLVGRADALIGRLFAVCMYRGIGLMVLLAIFVIGLLPTIPFERILREDANLYVEKALEIVNGDYTPPHGHFIGWPLLLAPVFALLQINDLFTAMYAARWVSVIFVCASIGMIYFICRRLVKGTNNYQIAAATAICAFISSIHIQFIARNAMTEPLFIFLALTSVYFLVDDRTTVKSITLSAVFASLAYYVRANGIFFLGAILAYLLLRAVLDRTVKPKLFLYAIVVFFLVSAPHMVNRYQAYGSAFDYGENSKYFVDDIAQVWAPNIKAPTLMEYLQTHTLSDYYEKFIVNGLWRVLTTLYSALMPEIWTIILIVSFLKYAFIKRDKRCDAFYTSLLVSIIGFSLVFDTFGSVRYILYLMPIILVASVGFLSSMDRNYPLKFSNIALFAVFLFSISGVVWEWKIDTSQFKIPELRDKWAIWAARHIEGTVVIIEGGDALKSAQHYGEFTHKTKTILPFDQVNRKIKTLRPGIYDRLEDALPEFEQMGVKYIITDGFHIRRRPYLKELQSEKWAGRFRHLKHFQRRPRGGILYDVNIYKVCYDEDCS